MHNTSYSITAHKKIGVLPQCLCLHKLHVLLFSQNYVAAHAITLDNCLCTCTHAKHVALSYEIYQLVGL